MGHRVARVPHDTDFAALELRAKGASYRNICDQLGISQSQAYTAVQRALAYNMREASEEVRQIELQRLDELTRKLNVVMASRHYVVANNGRVVEDPISGAPLQDHGPIIQAAMAMLRISERRSRLLGLDAPTRHEFLTMDTIDREIKRLEEELRRTGVSTSAARREIEAPRSPDEAPRAPEAPDPEAPEIPERP